MHVHLNYSSQCITSLGHHLLRECFLCLIVDSIGQGCQIFLGTTYQNGEKTYHITIKYTK
jgi:hypothetical protein